MKKFGIDLLGTYKKSLNQDSLEPLFDKINEILLRKEKWLFLLLDEFHLLPSRARNEGFYRRFSDDDIYEFFRDSLRAPG